MPRRKLQVGDLVVFTGNTPSDESDVADAGDLGIITEVYGPGPYVAEVVYGGCVCPVHRQEIAFVDHFGQEIL